MTPTEILFHTVPDCKPCSLLAAAGLLYSAAVNATTSSCGPAQWLKEHAAKVVIRSNKSTMLQMRFQFQLESNADKSGYGVRQIQQMVATNHVTY